MTMFVARYVDAESGRLLAESRYQIGRIETGVSCAPTRPRPFECCWCSAIVMSEPGHAECSCGSLYLSEIKQ